MVQNVYNDDPSMGITKTLAGTYVSNLVLPQVSKETNIRIVASKLNLR